MANNGTDYATMLNQPVGTESGRAMSSNEWERLKMSEATKASKFSVGQTVWFIESNQPTTATVIECDHESEFVRLSTGDSSYHPDECYFETPNEAWEAIEAEAAENVRCSEEYLKKQVDKLAKIRKDRAEFSETDARLKALQDAVNAATDREIDLTSVLDDAKARRGAAEKALTEFKAGM